MRQVTSATLSNQNIATALLVATYTCDADRLLFVRVVVDQVAGNGSYSAYVTLQEAGAGSAYQIQPVTTATVASGVTAIAFATIALPVKNTDVVKVYVLGLAGDTTTPDIITRILEDDSLRPTTADRTLDISSGGEAGVDWANVGSPTTTLNLSGTTVATVTTTTTATNLTNAPTSGDFTATMKTSITTAVPTAATIATAVWAALASAATTVGSLGKLIADNLDATVSSVYTRLGAPAGASMSADVAAVKTDTAAIKLKTDNLPASPASTTNITGGVITTVGTVTGFVTAGTVSDKTGYSLTVTPPTAAQIDTQLSGTHGSGGWATATGFATPSDVTTAQAAVTAAIAALNNLSSFQAQAAVAAALTAYSAATSTNVTAAQTAILAKLPAALSGGKMDSAISQLDTTAFSVALLQLIADHVLDRGAALNEASGVTTTKYSLYHLIMQILNGTMAGSTGTAYATDGSTAFTVPLTTDDAALPVTGTH